MSEEIAQEQNNLLFDPTIVKEKKKSRSSSESGEKRRRKVKKTDDKLDEIEDVENHEEAETAPEAAVEKTVEVRFKKPRRRTGPIEYDTIFSACDFLIPTTISSPKALGDAGLLEVDAEHDYTYDELLGRVFNIMNNRRTGASFNDEALAGIPPPKVARSGTKRTSFSNFLDLCRVMHRHTDHVMSFILTELSTSGSLDAAGHLILKGVHSPKSIEGILRKYLQAYVRCTACKSLETLLVKSTNASKMSSLICEQCGAHRSVAAIKGGYLAQVGRRKK